MTKVTTLMLATRDRMSRRLSFIRFPPGVVVPWSYTFTEGWGKSVGRLAFLPYIGCSTAAAGTYSQVRTSGEGKGSRGPLLHLELLKPVLLPFTAFEDPIEDRKENA